MPRLNINSPKLVAVLMLIAVCSFGVMFWFFSRGHSASQQGIPQEKMEFAPLEARGHGLSVVELTTVSAQVSWTANPEPNITGYELSYVAPPLAPQTIQTASTNLTVANLNPSTTYLFKVRAWVNGSPQSLGVPGPFSPEVPYTTQGATPTPSPTPTATATSTPTATATATPTATAAVTATVSPTPTATASSTAIPTATPTPSPNFTLLLGSNSITVPANGTATVLISVIRTGGFNSPVSLTVSGLGNYVETKFANSPTSLKRTLTFTVNAGLAQGNYPFTVTGQSYLPTLTRTAQATLVKP